MAVKILGIYGSPRKGGNTDLLLDRVLEGARGAGAEAAVVYARDLEICGCLECGGCDDTGECVVQDDMQSVYPLLQEADIIFLASPIFFYSVTAQVKALIDRTQAMWARRMLERAPGERPTDHSGTGYLISVGATRGANLFQGAELTARYFFDALDMRYEGGLFFSKIELKGEIAEHPEAMHQALALGRRAVESLHLSRERK
ncbi:MAG: flavodoxin family protein [Syntrophobacteria bacterium]